MKQTKALVMDKCGSSDSAFPPHTHVCHMQTDGKGDNPHAWLFSGPLRSHHGCQADHTKRLSYQYQFVHMPLPTRFFPCSNNPRSNAFALKGVCNRSKCTVIMTNQVRTKSQQKLQVGAFHTTVEKSPPPPPPFFLFEEINRSVPSTPQWR